MFIRWYDNVKYFDTICHDACKKQAIMVDLAFGRWYFMTFVITLIICGAYAVAATVILRTGYTYSYGNGFWSSYSEALVHYRRNDGAFIYLVPILSVLVTVIIETDANGSQGC